MVQATEIKSTNILLLYSVKLKFEFPVITKCLKIIGISLKPLSLGQSRQNMQNIRSAMLLDFCLIYFETEKQQESE